MPINRSRYSKSFDWDGPKSGAKARAKQTRMNSEKWKRRFYITLTLSIAIIAILALAVVLLWLRLGDDGSGADTADETVSTALDTATWETFRNEEVSVAVSYPPTWNLTSQDGETDLDVVNVEITGASTDGVTGSLNLDVIQNKDSLTLQQWVNRFGVQDIESGAVTVAEKDALLATFESTGSGEEQNVYYILNGDYIFVVDLYQDAADAEVQEILNEMLSSITFMLNGQAGVAGQVSGSESSSSSAPLSLKGAKLVVNEVVAEKVDELSSYKLDGTGATLLFTDEEEAVFYKGAGAIAYESSEFFAYFGNSADSAEGVYVMDLSDQAPELERIVNGVEPGIIRVSADGSVVGYIDGTAGDATTIELIDGKGKEIGSIKVSAGVQDFDISADGEKIAYVEPDSGDIEVVDQSGESLDTLEVSSLSVLSFDWRASDDQVAFVADESGKTTNNTELYVHNGTKATQLTDDSFAQGSPTLGDANTVVYSSFSVGNPASTSVWQILSDGTKDTNILKSANQSLIGWLL